MSIRVIYDRQADVLRLLTDKKGQTSTPLVELVDVVLDLVADESDEVTALEIIGASAYLPLGRRGYDAATDTLTLGTVDNPKHVTRSENIVTYWQPDEYEPETLLEPAGIAIRQASEHLNGIT